MLPFGIRLQAARGRWLSGERMQGQVVALGQVCQFGAGQGSQEGFQGRMRGRVAHAGDAAIARRGQAGQPLAGALEQRDLVVAGEPPRGVEARDARADDACESDLVNERHGGRLLAELRDDLEQPDDLGRERLRLHLGHP